MKDSHKFAVVIGIYIFLLMVCVSMMVLGDRLSYTARDEIIPAAREGFRLVIAALLGALSTIPLGNMSKERNGSGGNQ